MKGHPEIKKGDWIRVGATDCVVAIVYQENSMSGVCKAIFNKSKPTTHDVDWNGESWFFPARPDYGGYAKNSDPLVQQLKRGKEA